MEGFDSAWEKVHSEKEWGKYPPEKLIRFIMGNYKHLSFTDRKNIKILELGLGQGANIWFLTREGFDAYGMDGSKSAVEKAVKRFEAENLKADFRVGDFNNLDCYENESFDIIIDIAALKCNRVDNIKSILKQCQQKLKSGGKIFCMMIAIGSFGDNMGDELESHTFTNIPEGPFKGVGTVHFFDLIELKSLFEIFSSISIEYSIRSLYGGEKEIKHWLVSGVK